MERTKADDVPNNHAWNSKHRFVDNIVLEYHLQQTSIFFTQTLKIFEWPSFICHLSWQRAQGNLELPARYVGSWPMLPSLPLRQVCCARTSHPITTWMASYHHVANSSPTCHMIPAPPAEPQPPLKEHGLDLASSWRLTSTTAISLPGHCPEKQSFRCLCLEAAQYNSPRPSSCSKKGARKKNKLDVNIRNFADQLLDRRRILIGVRLEQNMPNKIQCLISCVVEKECWRRVLYRSVGEERWKRRLLNGADKSAGEKGCTEESCREVFGKSVGRECCWEVVGAQCCQVFATSLLY